MRTRRSRSSRADRHCADFRHAQRASRCGQFDCDRGVDPCASPHYAVAWAAFFNFIAFLFFGLNVAHTVGTGIVSADTVDAAVIFGALSGAIVWNLITWWLGIPSSSSHALIGGLAGGGKGAGIGALIGAAAGTGGAGFTGNRDITLAAETALEFKLLEPVSIKQK